MKLIGETDLSHFVMEGNLLIGRRLVRSENTADDVGARGGATYIRKFFETESFNDVVEIGSRGDGRREASEQNRAGVVDHRFQPRLLITDECLEIMMIRLRIRG